jgi:hypothetical protein
MVQNSEAITEKQKAIETVFLRSCFYGSLIGLIDIELQIPDSGGAHCISFKRQNFDVDDWRQPSLWEFDHINLHQEPPISEFQEPIQIPKEKLTEILHSYGLTLNDILTHGLKQAE